MSQKTTVTILTICASLLLVGYWLTVHRRKGEPSYSQKISGQQLFEEKYTASYGGSLNGNSYSFYVTDSTHFRKFIGPCEDREFFNFYVKNDSLVAIKRTFTFRGQSKTIDSLSFSVSRLKIEHKFD